MAEKTFTKIYHKKFPLWQKQNRKLGKEAKIIYMYLLSSPFTHHSGVFEFPDIMYQNTGLTQKEIDKGVSELLRNGLITVCERLEYVLIPYLLDNFEIANQNILKNIINHLSEFSDSETIMIKIAEILNIPNRLANFKNEKARQEAEELINRFETVLKPFKNRSETIPKQTETETETINRNNKQKIDTENKKQEIEKNIVSNKLDTLVISDKPKRPKKDEAYYLQYLEIWNNFLDSNNNKFGLKRTTGKGFLNIIPEIKKYEKKGLNLNVYKEALQESIHNSFLFGDNDRNWKMDILFLMNEGKRAKLYAGKYTGSKQMESDNNFNKNLYGNIDPAVLGF